MPAHSKYPTVHEQLRALALLARQDALPFDRWWVLALRPGEPPVTWSTPELARPGRCVIWPRDTIDRRLSIQATLEARDGWRRAYERAKPTGPEKALRLLAPLLELMGDAVEDPVGFELWGPTPHHVLPPEQLALAVSLSDPR